MKKSVLITGANGFIGLNIVKTFCESAEFDVTALVYNNISYELKALNVEIIKADLTKNNNDIKNFDIIIHAAGLASDIGSDEKFKKINFDSVRLVSQLAKEKFIYISSTDVYGIKDFSNANEETQFSCFPKNPYPKYKIEAEKWLKNNYNKKYVIIRPAAVWGENDLTLEKRVVDFLSSSPFIVHFGKWKGSNRWPVANVKYIADVIKYCSLNDEFDFQAINIVDSQKVTIDDYYKKIAQKYFPNKKFKTIYLPFWIGKSIGFVSTLLSNLLKLKAPLFDPTFYSIYHVSSNLDFDNTKMLKILESAKRINSSKGADSVEYAKL